MSKGSRALPSPAMHYFGDSRCRSIWQWQLILAFTAVTIGAGSALLTPERFSDARFSGGLLLIVLVTTGSLATPWHRIASSGVLMLPVIDALAIALVAAGGASAATFLWVFPVAWAGAYFSAAVLIGMLTLIAVLRVINLIALGITDEAMIDVVMLMTTLGFVGVIMAVGSDRNRSARRLLSSQSDRLAHALRRVKEQKARNQRVLNSLDIGIARVGPGGLIEASNDAFRTIFGLDAATQFHPSSAVEYSARRGTPVPADRTVIARASRGELFSDQVVWLFGLDGRWRAVNTSATTIEHGIVTGDGLLLVVEDVTEKTDPQASDDARRRTISHELRNPLTAILGHVDLLLERDDLASAARDQLTVVERAGERMQSLIDQVLVAPRHLDDEAGVDFDLAEIGRSSLQGFAPAADSAGVTVESDLTEPLELCGDAFRIRQVVDNVIGNAIKYAQRGGRVSVRGLKPAPDEVALLIQDNGIGISEKDLPRIFERDFRTQLALERGIPGTGLGLSISREIVVAAGGRIAVHSTLGHGTEVGIFLPTGRASPPGPGRRRDTENHGRPDPDAPHERTPA